jgi:hypothetical protein
VTDRPVFTSVIAQYWNLGDVVLRRQLLDWLTEAPDLRLQVGAMPEDYLEALPIPSGTRLYRDRREWMRDQLREPGAITVWTPGPQSLSKRGPIGAEASRVGWGTLTRIRGGRNLTIGRGYGTPSRLGRFVAWASGRTQSAVLVRDRESTDIVARARLCPDLAFDAFDAPPTSAGAHLAVSLRNDRDLDRDDLLRTIDALATSRDLEPLVVTQVRTDADNNERLADVLGVEHVGGEASTTRAWLDEVSAAYRRTGTVLSDRLHALAFGVAQGAVPVAPPHGVPEKVTRTLSAAGFVVALPSDAQGMATQEWEAARAGVLSTLAQAQRQLASHREDVRRLITGVDVA